MSSSVTAAGDQLADFTRDKRIILLAAMALVIGGISALVADALVWLIAVITNACYYGVYSPILHSPSENHLGLYAVLIPIAGGLVIGFMARYGSEKIRGHGIPEALEAILFGRSRMEPKVAFLKPVSSAISIGTGGPFGAEGPIIMTGGAVGSLFGQMFHLSSAERKTLLVAGAAGGMSAIFATPIAAVFLAVELLLFEWKPRSIIPVAIASLTAYACRVPLMGSGPVFATTGHAMLGAEGLLFAFGVGIVAGLGSGLLTALVYGFEDLFPKLKIHWMWWPAIAGLFIGVGGLIEPRVLGIGYDTIHSLLRGELIGAAVIGILIGKALIWSLSLGSGTSGGVLAPLLMIGGAFGAIEAGLIPIGDAGLWALVSMAAMMGGTMRSPLTAMIFAVELTQDYGVLPMILVACVAAYGVSVLLMRRSILTEKVARRGYHINREYSIDPLVSTRVAEVMDPEATAINASLSVAELAGMIAANNRSVTRHHGIPIIDDQGKLVGIITRGDIVKSLAEDPGGSRGVLEAGTGRPIVAYPDEVLHEAATRMLHYNIGRLPVVQRADPTRLTGYLGRVHLLQARSRQLEEEHVRDRGWYGGKVKSGA
ncbi:MAG: chloride channel protein [Candidatus Zixiibacteriota bacterium]